MRRMVGDESRGNPLLPEQAGSCWPNVRRYSGGGTSTPDYSREGEEEDPSCAHVQLVKRRYERVASLYDILTARAGWFSSSWRRRTWEEAQGKILEVGVGTGKNIPFYPPECEVTAIDLSSNMLERAQRRAARIGRQVRLLEMDMTRLSFENACFDTVVATFVLSALPEPAEGLSELRRVLRPEGRLLLVEYAPPRSKIEAWTKDLVDFMAYYFFGPLRQVDTEHVHRAGLEVVKEEYFWPGVARLIVAR